MIVAAPSSAQDLLALQLSGSFQMLRDLVGDVTEEEWAADPGPELNPIGFTVWHCARVIDWAVNCMCRGELELADSPAWRDRLAPDAWFGWEVTPEAARLVATRVEQPAIAAYLDALEPTVIDWIQALPAPALTSEPDVDVAYRRSGAYLEAPWLEQGIAEDRGTPVWRFISGPCGGHIRVHIGEARTLLQVIRNRKS